MVKRGVSIGTQMGGSPHDALFRSALADPSRADTFVRESLPKEVAAELAETPVQVVDGTFIEPALREIRSDMLFKARLRLGGDAYLFVLIEHKSVPDPDIHLQLLGYMLEIWRRHVGSAKGRALRLPPIVPVVVYNGSREWRIPLSLRDCIAGTGESAEMSRSFTYRLRDLVREDSGALSRDGVLNALLSLLRSVYRNAPPGPLLRSVLPALGGDRGLVMQAFAYILRTTNLTPEAVVRAVRDSVGQEMEEEVRTAADILIERGVAKGLERGRTEGLSEGRAAGLSEGRAAGLAEGRTTTLLRLLSRRFGEVPPAVRTRVLAASGRELDAWTDAVLEADSLDSVLAATPG